MTDSLAAMQGPDAAPPEVVDGLKRRAWRSHGLALLAVDDIPDRGERAVVVRLAERMFGKRRPEGRQTAKRNNGGD